jgi:hypothetical protein
MGVGALIGGVSGLLIGGVAGVGAVGEVAEFVAVAGPVKEDAGAEAVFAIVHLADDVLVADGGGVPGVVVAVDEDGEVFLLLVFGLGDFGEFVGDGLELFAEFARADFFPILGHVGDGADCGGHGLVAGVVGEGVALFSEDAAGAVAVGDHPVLRHGGEESRGASSVSKGLIPIFPGQDSRGVLGDSPGTMGGDADAGSEREGW